LTSAKLMHATVLIDCTAQFAGYIKALKGSLNLFSSEKKKYLSLWSVKTGNNEAP